MISGGVVWVLAIKNVKLTDSGLYACEINSNPVIRTYHKLSGELLPYPNSWSSQTTIIKEMVNSCQLLGLGGNFKILTVFQFSFGPKEIIPKMLKTLIWVYLSKYVFWRLIS